MRKSTWLLSFLVPLIIVTAHADTSNRVHNVDLEARKAKGLADAKKRGMTNLVYYADLGWVGIDNRPEHKPTEEECFRRKMNEMLPYEGEYVSRFRFSTLGQLAKVSDYIAVGKVVSVKPIGRNELRETFSMSVTIDTVLFGNIADRTITVTSQWGEDWEIMDIGENRCKWNYRSRPNPGDRLLLFMSAEFSKSPYSPIPPEVPPDEVKFTFKKERTPRQGAYHLLYWEGGARYLDTPENTTNYLNAVKGYLRELRGNKRDADSYYSFLADLIQSSVQSIREDARSDLMYLVESCPSFDKKRILSDDRIDEALKYWVDPGFLKAKEQKKEK